LIIFIVAVIFSISGYAAVNTYVFSKSTGTYTALSASRTIVFTATANATVDPGLGNSQIFSGTIPFNFYYDGTAYTTLKISTNGFVTFGATSLTTTNITHLSSMESYRGCITVCRQYV